MPPNPPRSAWRLTPTLFLVHFLPIWWFLFTMAYSSSKPSQNTSHHLYRLQRQIPWLGSTEPNRPSKHRNSHLAGEVRSEFARPPAYTHKLPYNVLLILPSKESENDKFRLTSAKAKPVIDIAIEDITISQILPPGWINITYHDSRYWEDTLLAERYATKGVVQAYCEDRLDAILGFADAYSLATVSKISAGFRHGVPVITTTGLNSQIGSKKSYPYVTRMTGSYYQMAESTYQFIAHREEAGNSTNLNYENLLFMYHDKRRAINRPQVAGENADDYLSSHCYFAMHAIKNYFKEKVIFLKNGMVQTPYTAFDEEMARTKDDVEYWVKIASESSNGKYCLPRSVIFEKTTKRRSSSLANQPKWIGASRASHLPAAASNQSSSTTTIATTSTSTRL
uniref:Receptor ligand binding region domain-containing protein n=1 Tax=Ditylenchus dipsaci TaxID=166011 RepID=A0A915DX20_9BILA